MLAQNPSDRRRLFLVLAATLMMLWPAVVNGGVFFYEDSVGYITGPDKALDKLLGHGHGTAWSAKPLRLLGKNRPETPDEARRPPMTGRSFYYALLANLGVRTGGSWLTAFVQALAAVLALDYLCRSVGWRRQRGFLTTVGIAAFLTPLAFNVDNVMPDAWTSTLIIMAGAIAAGGERMKLHDWVIALAILSFAASAHTSHLLLLSATAGVGGILLIPRYLSASGQQGSVGAPGRLVLVSLAALMIGVGSGAIFNAAVTKAFGQAPWSPPFLTARLVGDGRPGDVWLRKHCHKPRFHACAFVSSLPISTHDFLWPSSGPKTAVGSASTAEKIAVGNEQYAFVWAVFRDDPLGVVRQLVSDGFAQFTTISLSEINYPDPVRGNIEYAMPGSEAARWRASLAWRKAWPTGLMDVIQTTALLLAGVGLASLILPRRNQETLKPQGAQLRFLQASAVIVTAVAANAVICGGLSDINARYQIRATAPLILIGMMALIDLMLRSNSDIARTFFRIRRVFRRSAVQLMKIPLGVRRLDHTPSTTRSRPL